MQAFTLFWNQIMSMATLLAMAMSIVLLYALILPETSFAKKINSFVGKYFLGIGFLISLAALVSSLVYSNVIGFPPCMLCWYARIVFYPQVLLFAVALWKRDRKVLDYSLGLTILGLVISGYHVISENIGYTPLPCAASGPSCLIKYVYEYGFITIPFMGLMGFVTLFLILLIAKRASKTRVL